MLRIARERHAGRAAAEPAVRVERDAIVRPRRRDGHRRRRRLETGTCQQPAGGERFGERHRERKAPGDTENRKAVGEACPRAAQMFRDPGERQPRLAERVPQRRLPRPVVRLVDALRIGEVGKNPLRRFGNDMALFAGHECRWAPFHRSTAIAVAAANFRCDHGGA